MAFYEDSSFGVSSPDGLDLSGPSFSCNTKESDKEGSGHRNSLRKIIHSKFRKSKLFNFIQQQMPPESEPPDVALEEDASPNAIGKATFIPNVIATTVPAENVVLEPQISSTPFHPVRDQFAFTENISPISSTDKMKEPDTFKKIIDDVTPVRKDLVKKKPVDARKKSICMKTKKPENKISKRRKTNYMKDIYKRVMEIEKDVKTIKTETNIGNILRKSRGRLTRHISYETSSDDEENILQIVNGIRTVGKNKNQRDQQISPSVTTRSSLQKVAKDPYMKMETVKNIQSTRNETNAEKTFPKSNTQTNVQNPLETSVEKEEEDMSIDDDIIHLVQESSLEHIDSQYSKNISERAARNIKRNVTKEASLKISLRKNLSEEKKLRDSHPKSIARQTNIEKTFNRSSIRTNDQNAFETSIDEEENMHDDDHAVTADNENPSREQRVSENLKNITKRDTRSMRNITKEASLQTSIRVVPLETFLEREIQNDGSKNITKEAITVKSHRKSSIRTNEQNAFENIDNEEILDDQVKIDNMEFSIRKTDIGNEQNITGTDQEIEILNKQRQYIPTDVLNVSDIQLTNANDNPNISSPSPEVEKESAKIDKSIKSSSENPPESDKNKEEGPTNNKRKRRVRANKLEVSPLRERPAGKRVVKKIYSDINFQLTRNQLVNWKGSIQDAIAELNTLDLEGKLPKKVPRKAPSKKSQETQAPPTAMATEGESVEKKKKGRPKKILEPPPPPPTAMTAKEEPVKEKKKRGRPKKNTLVSATTTASKDEPIKVGKNRGPLKKIRVTNNMEAVLTPPPSDYGIEDDHNQNFYDDSLAGIRSDSISIIENKNIKTIKLLRSFEPIPFSDGIGVSIEVDNLDPSCGIMTFEPYALKHQGVSKKSLRLFPIQGSCTIKVVNSVFEIKGQQIIIIPANTTYSIKNHTKEVCKVLFVIHADPIY